MSYIKINNEYLGAIADAIRKKSGNVGNTRIETETVTTIKTQTVKKILRTLSAIDATTVDSDTPYWKWVIEDGDYTEAELKQLKVNKDTTTWKAAQIAGAKKIKVDISYQPYVYPPSANGSRRADVVQVMPGIVSDYDESAGGVTAPTYTDGAIHTVSYTFENVNSVSMVMKLYQVADYPIRAGFLGFYAEVTGYDADGNIITEQVEETTEVEKEVPNTYTPEQMAAAILKLQPAPYVAYITLDNIPRAFFNENFNTTGLQVTAHYSNNTQAIVTNWSSSIADGTTLDAGHYIVTITYTDNNGIQATADYDIDVYNLNLVTWADGSDEDIVAMIAAADAGRINLSDYWNIGDERKITMDSTQLTDTDKNQLKYLGFECVKQGLGVQDPINFGVGFQGERALTIVSFSVAKKYALVKSTIARSTPNLIVQFKETSPYLGQLDLSTDVSRYDGTQIAHLLNSIWYKTLPQWLQNSIKKVKVQCAIPPKAPQYGFEGYYYYQSKLFLPACEEIKAITNNRDTDGMAQWEYYILNADGAIKTGPNQTAPKTWWLRTCNTGYVSGTPYPRFYSIATTGEAAAEEAATGSHAIAPAFCL